MDYEETAVEDFDNTEVDDALPEEVVEEDVSEEESLESLNEDEGQPEEPQAQQATEPGYIKGRINKAVQRAVAETEARMQAMFDEQMAPIRERMIEMDAQELVRTGVVKDLETAKELVRYRQGQPAAQAEPEPQPRNEQGQFAPRQDPGTSARVDMLAHQADRIKERTGVDVIDIFTNDEDIKQAVISGEMDFYDVADMMKETKRKPPAPMRSPNGASGKNTNAITTMSDEQFERMEKRIKEGARYSLK